MLIELHEEIKQTSTSLICLVKGHYWDINALEQGSCCYEAKTYPCRKCDATKTVKTFRDLYGGRCRECGREEEIFLTP